MQRTIEYRGFEFHIDLVSTSKDMFDVWFRFEGHVKLPARDPVKQPTRLKPLQVMGPGLITGASDDDPSGIATYSQVGAQFGYGLAWTLLFSYPLMAAIQEISARIGRVTGSGIAGNLRQYYPRWLSTSVVGLLLVANIINLDADLGAMGAALKLLISVPALLYICGFGLLSVALEVFTRYARYVSVLKWLWLFLMSPWHSSSALETSMHYLMAVDAGAA